MKKNYKTHANEIEREKVGRKVVSRICPSHVIEQIFFKKDISVQLVEYEDDYGQGQQADLNIFNVSRKKATDQSV